VKNHGFVIPWGQTLFSSSCFYLILYPLLKKIRKK